MFMVMRSHVTKKQISLEHEICVCQSVDMDTLMKNGLPVLKRRVDSFLESRENMIIDTYLGQKLIIKQQKEDEDASWLGLGMMHYL